ncbi:TPA: antiviral RADAR system adenosine triphosphatase RdrA [Proteus mirabilis]
MSSEIILNLDLPEYQEDFYSTDENAEQNGLWQQTANKSLTRFLKKMGENAKKYKKNHIGINESEPNLNSYQHAIFISGARGTGKTVFLRNAKKAWEFYCEKQKTNIPTLHFIDAIDPTLLNINDRFSEVIIASVYASVDKKLKHPDIKQEKKDRFYNSLKTLSSALGKSSEFDEYRGIDRIQKYRSGIHIERYFHQFLIASVDLLGCDALVLPIDDVDMKIDNAFGVLDDIRCLLSCPLILPLVSGDDEMYRHITTMKFEESLAKNTSASNFTEGKNMAESLSTAYLTKIFPNNDRIRLIPINQLISNLRIKYTSTSNSDKKSLMYNQYEKNIKKFFYPLCNGQERSTDWPTPESAREISQFIRLITPEMLDSSHDDYNTLWRQFAIWAEEKQDGIALTNAESFFTINAMQPSDEFNLNKIIAFSPLMQKNYRPWVKKNFYGQQLKCISDLKAYSTNSDILNTVFTKNQDGIALKENNILRSFPPLEFIMEPMYISKKIAEQNNENTILISLYTYNEYYSKQLNRRYHIFFSRAFEILFWSLLSVTGNIPKKLREEDSFKNNLRKIFSAAPFYSIFSLNPTRIFDEKYDDSDSDSDSDSELDNNIDSSIENVESIKQFINDIYNWCKENESNIKELKNHNMIPLLTFTFNKVFSQLNTLRQNILTDKTSFKFQDEHLTDLSKRFEYIFINALTTFLSEGTIVQTNVATGAKSSSVRNYQEFIKSDRTLSRNISDLHLFDDSILQTTTSRLLIEIMWKHPIFKLIPTYPVYPISSRTKSESEIKNTTKTDQINNPNLSTLDANGLINYYYHLSGKNYITIDSVYYWVMTNKENQTKALEIYYRIFNDTSLHIQALGTDYLSRLFKGIARALNLNEE